MKFYLNKVNDFRYHTDIKIGDIVYYGDTVTDLEKIVENNSSQGELVAFTPDGYKVDIGDNHIISTPLVYPTKEYKCMDMETFLKKLYTQKFPYLQYVPTGVHILVESYSDIEIHIGGGWKKLNDIQKDYVFEDGSSLLVEV